MHPVGWRPRRRRGPWRWQRLPDGPTYVGIAPGSRQANKNWPLERFCEAARALLARGVTPVFLLGPQEGDVEARIREAAPGALVLRAEPAAAPGASLDLLIAEGQRFAALLANDNGVGHLLGAGGVPVVSLFGPTDPARWAPVAPANTILKASDFGGGSAIEAIPVGPGGGRCDGDAGARRGWRKADLGRVLTRRLGPLPGANPMAAFDPIADAHWGVA